MQPETSQELAKSCILLLLKSSRKERRTRKSYWEWSNSDPVAPQKGDVRFNSVLLKIGNARETTADLNSCWSDKPEEQYWPGKSDMVFPFPQLFFFF